MTRKQPTVRNKSEGNLIYYITKSRFFKETGFKPSIVVGTVSVRCECCKATASCTKVERVKPDTQERWVIAYCWNCGSTMAYTSGNYYKIHIYVRGIKVNYRALALLSQETVNPLIPERDYEGEETDDEENLPINKKHKDLVDYPTYTLVLLNGTKLKIEGPRRQLRKQLRGIGFSITDFSEKGPLLIQRDPQS